MQKKDPEFKKMMGVRRMNDDGFTYVYGRIKRGCPTNRSANRPSIKRQIRNDKRSVKQETLRRIREEE